ncbi:hypothetical protein SY88_17210 [Clostridiales bacterium PH28_bin88]|nr:hypothetical protein SY88_17210 [Clostridiales bacterium PH28_bin88]
MECALPAVLAAEKGLNEPRMPTVPGMLKARKAKDGDRCRQPLGWRGSSPAPTGNATGTGQIPPFGSI